MTAGEAQESFTGHFTVSQDLPYLQGHFPGLPLVPAVVLLEVSQAFLRAALDQPKLAVTKAKHCKFKGMVTPGETYRLDAEKQRGGGWQLTWTSADAGAIVELGFELR